MANERSPLPQHLLTALLELAAALEQFHVRYALVGAVASGYRSRPRFTEDLDFLLDVPQLVLPGLLEELRERGFSFEMEPTIRDWVQQHLAVLKFNGIQIDWLKPLVPCYQYVLDTAKVEAWLGA